MFCPSVATVLSQISTMSNLKLERFYRDAKLRKIRSFGKPIIIPKKVLEIIELEIRGRNDEGRYLFNSRSEKKRMPYRRNLGEVFPNEFN